MQHFEHHVLPKLKKCNKKELLFFLFNMFNTLQSQIICKLLLAYPSSGSKLLQILYEDAYSNQNICQHHILSRINPSDKTMSNLNENRFAFHLLQTVECSKHCKLECFGSVLAVSKAGGGSWWGGATIYIYIYIYIFLICANSDLGSSSKTL